MGQDERNPRRAGGQGIGSWIAWPLLVFALGATLFAWREVRNAVEIAAQEKLERHSAELVRALHERVFSFGQAVQSAEALFAASNSVEAEEWDAYLREVDLFRRSPGLVAVVYARFGDGKNTSTCDLRERSAIIAYPGPFGGLSPGYDLSSNHALSEALQRSCTTGQVSLSAQLDETVSRAIGGGADIAIIYPVRDKAKGASRQRSYAGFIVAFAESQGIFRDLGAAEPELLFAVDDVEGVRAVTLYESGDQARSDDGVAPHSVQAIETFGRHWKVRSAFVSGNGAYGREFRPAMVLALGILTSLLLFAVVLTLAMTRRRAVYIANEMTEELRTSQAALFKAAEVLEAILANVTTLIAYLDRDFNFIRVNSSYALAGGHPPEFFVGKNHFDLYPHQDNERIFRQVVETGETYSIAAKPFEYPDQPERGVTYWDWTLRAVKDADGKVQGVLLSLVEVTARIRAEERVRLWGRAMESTVNAVVITDAKRPHLPIVYVNPAFERITGYTEEEVRGRNPRFLQGDDVDQPGVLEIKQAVRERREGCAVLRNYRKDGTPFWNELHISPVRDEQGEVTHFVGVQDDITAQKYYEAELERRANYDTLTGLPNRNLLRDRLEWTVAYSRRSGRKAAVLFLDIDGFKTINEALGHNIGDELLQKIAVVLRQTVREVDTVSRYGGDEFVILIQDVEREEDLSSVSTKLLNAVGRPHSADNREFRLTCSIGVSIYPRDGETSEALMKNADSALYRAKELGRQRVEYFTSEINQWVNERLELENSLSGAWERGELLLHYQPQIDLRTGEVLGVEALARWNRPGHGMIPPDRFIPFAEESGLIIPMGEWVLRSACAALRRWRDGALPVRRVAVNVSARQLTQGNLATTVEALLKEFDLEAGALEIELTESMVLHNLDVVNPLLKRLRELGVMVALDDFGTGYSSLNYLRRLAVNTLKIDKSFINEIVSDPGAVTIVRAIIGLAHDMNLQVIAEGVELREQASLLRSRNCDAVQGYYFSRPLPESALTEFLQQRPLMAVGEGGGDRSLLLVDDEENVLSALTRTLRREGYRLFKTTSPTDALRILASESIGVVICDQRMPEMSGIEFLRRIKQIYPETVRIMLSGFTEVGSVTAAINEGSVYKFLTKPWDEEELKGVVRRAFELFESTVEGDGTANSEMRRQVKP